MSWFWIIVMVVVGLILVALEIVALPGLVAGLLGLAMVVVGVWQTYAAHGSTAGNIMLISSMATGIAILAFFMRSGTWHPFSLREEIDGRANVVDGNKIKVGSKGQTLSRLAPAGKALIDGEIVEVHSEGEFIDEGTEIEVTDIEGYKIIVRKTATTN